MSWQAVIETWPTEALLYIPELPGFFVRAGSSAGAVPEASERVDAYEQWLRDGELLPADSPSPEGVVVAEERSAQDDIGPVFALDAAQIDNDHAEFALAVGRAALSDLLFVFDDIADEEKSAAERTLRHVAEMDRWYATRMAPAQGKPFEALEDEVVQSASLFEETVDAVIAANRPATWTIDGETWSVRKALRRRTAHLREHLPDLRHLAR